LLLEIVATVVKEHKADDKKNMRIDCMYPSFKKMVGVARLELTTPRSQSECATNCATPRLFQIIFKY
jgi:hypothetical protein